MSGDFTLMTLPLLAMPILVIVAGLTDLTTMKIPNWISIALLFSFYPVALLMGLSLAEVAQAAAVGFGMLLAGMAMFALRWMGGGDAKLLATAGLWMGVPGILPFVLMTALAGGGLCLVLMSARAWLQVYEPAMPGWGQRLLQPKGDIPYGVAIAAGALMAYPHSALVEKFLFV